MKKRLWLLVLPVLLFSGVFWARDAAWRKTEADFHRAAHAWLWEAASTRVYPDSSHQDHDTLVFFDQSADALLKIDQMKLIRSSSPRPQNQSLIFVSMSDGGSVGETWGFYLSRQGDRGWIEIPMLDVSNVYKWRAYELAPETCRAFKKRIATLKQDENGKLFTSK